MSSASSPFSSPPILDPRHTRGSQGRNIHSLIDRTTCPATRCAHSYGHVGLALSPNLTLKNHAPSRLGQEGRAVLLHSRHILSAGLRLRSDVVGRMGPGRHRLCALEECLDGCVSFLYMSQSKFILRPIRPRHMKLGNSITNTLDRKVLVYARHLPLSHAQLELHHRCIHRPGIAAQYQKWLQPPAVARRRRDAVHVLHRQGIDR